MQRANEAIDNRRTAIEHDVVQRASFESPTRVLGLTSALDELRSRTRRSRHSARFRVSASGRLAILIARTYERNTRGAGVSGRPLFRA